MAETSVTSESNDLEELLAKGSAYLQKDQLEEARDCFQEALELAPEDEKVLGLFGLTHFRLDDFAAASEVYQRLVKKRPTDASYRLNLGLVHLKLNKPVEAIEELDRSRELDPSQVRTISYLGLAYARNGEYAKAYDAFLRADQTALATEMEQYLSETERDAIREKVSESVHAAEDEAPAIGAEEAEGAEEAPESTEAAGSAESAEAELSADAIAEFDADVADESQSQSIVVDIEETGPRPPATQAAAAPEPIAEAGMITRAVDTATPSRIAEVQEAPIGHIAPQAISTLATQRLLRPSEGGQVLEIGAGGVLIARVNNKLIARTQGVMVSSGELGFEPATRRVRGQQSDEVFGSGDARLYVVTGEGYLITSSCGEVFTAVLLDDDVLYLREEYVFAFDPNLRWENGRIPGSDFHVAQFRGAGCVAIRTPKEPLSVKLSADRVMYVESDVLAGWIGRVVPKLVNPAAGGRASTPFVECSGEGVVLLHDMQGLA